MAIVRVYFDMDLRLGLDGLQDSLRQKRIAVDNMKPADFVLFMNRKKTHFKMLFGGSYVLNYKSPKGRVSMEAIQGIPNYFKGKIVTAQKIEDQLEKALALKDANYVDEEGRKAV